MNIEKLQQLIKQKDTLEAEIQALIEFLNRPGNFGVKGPLVDKEGFPIVDYEKAFTVREARGMLQRKQNDHIALMKQIELGLYEVHAAARQRKETQNQTLSNSSSTSSSSSSPSPSSYSSTSASSTVSLPSTTTMSTTVESNSQPQQMISETSFSSSSVPSTSTFTSVNFKLSKAFARVNSVIPSSPAAISGLQVGDLILHFGTINFDNNNNLLSIRDVVLQNENKEIQVVVRRNQDEIHTLVLVPRKWSGHGLLGCHLLPHKE